jgi:2-polyprenyl-6-hydroxyphenyl methylase/3-demethylubiquinone-9 3-methyltransferase
MTWPRVWRESWHYDCLDFGGSTDYLGYTRAYRNRFVLTMNLVRKTTPPPARVLDLAAAQGNFSLALAEEGYSVTWNDLREELAGYVRLKYERGVLDFKPGNAFELRPQGPFDIVVATEVIEHVAHPDEFLSHLLGLVRQGGHAILTTPNGGYFRNQLPKFSECADPSVFEERQFGPDGTDHIFLLHEEELRDLAAQAGWQVAEVHLYTSFLLNGHCRTEPLLRILPGAVGSVDTLLQRLPRTWRRRVDVGLAAVLRRP